MTPQQQLMEIFAHIQSLENSTSELSDRINSLSQLHSELPTSDSEINTEFPQNVNEMHTVLSNKMTHTEQMIENMLHPERMNQLVNFMVVMHDAVNHVEEEDDGSVV